MRNRTVFRRSTTTLLTALGGIALLGCGGQPVTPSDTTTSANEALAAIAACGMDDGTIEPGAHLHACDPQDVKKTTICHIPPGNPANAHTICVGNSAVSHHVKNHGDLIGPCQAETTCPPPPPPPPMGTGGATGSGGATGAGGSPAPICPDGQLDCSSDSSVCPAEVTYCSDGCCVPGRPI